MDNSGMIDYFYAQPKLLRGLLENSRVRVSPFCEYWTRETFDRLYLIGSGTSYHAIHAVQRWVEAFLGVEVTSATPTSLPHIRGQNPLIMLISQSGASTNTIKAAEMLNSYRLLGLTGEAKSPLDRVTEIQLNLGIGQEKAGPKTIGYTATILFLLLASLEAGQASGHVAMSEGDRITNSVTSAVNAVEENIRRTEVWFETNKDEIAKIRKYVIVGKGGAGAVAGEGALKILETVKVSAVGYEFEEYLHGPILQTDADLGGIYYIPDDEDRQRVESLAELHSSVSSYVYRIYGDKPSGGLQDLSLILTGQEYTKGIELIYPCQIIGAKIPQMTGRHRGRNFFREYIAKHRIKMRD